MYHVTLGLLGINPVATG